jgi:Cu/Ag efflux pump CusA
MSSAGSDLERPLALVILGGLTCLMFLTLFLIPVLYEAYEIHKEKRKQKREAREKVQGQGEVK